MNRILRLLTPRPRVAAAAFALAFLAGPAWAAWDLQQLMDLLAQNKSGRATFVETKRIALLTRPVESSGELIYTAPDKLEKRTLKPRPESMSIDGDALTIERGNRKFQLQLRTQPELAAFIDSIRATLAGDRKVLERSYQLALSGTQESWVLQLLPLDDKMKAFVQRIRITGARDQVGSIETTQADGDSSLMVIEKASTSP